MPFRISRAKNISNQKIQLYIKNMYKTKKGEVREYCKECNSNILASTAAKHNGLCKQCAGVNTLTGGMSNQEIEKKYRNHVSDRLPRSGESCCVSDNKYVKRDALLFDRVYKSNFEKNIDIPTQLTFGIAELDKKTEQQEFGMVMCGFGIIEPDVTIANTANIYNKMGYVVTPAYSKEVQFYQEFSEGQQHAYQGALNNLPVPGESTPWECILEFRQDVNETGKLRNLKLWLEHSFDAKSEQHATDIISQKIEDYIYAIKKHGVETTIGSLSSVVQFKSSVMTSAAAFGGIALGSPILGWLAGGAVLCYQVGIKVAEHKLSLEDIKRGKNREIAMIYDAQKIFGDK